MLSAIHGLSSLSLMRRGLLLSILSSFIEKQSVNFSGKAVLGLCKTAVDGVSLSSVELKKNTLMEVTLVAKRNRVNIISLIWLCLLKATEWDSRL